MKHLLFTCILLFCQTVFSQVTIEGKVNDANTNEPISFASVVIQGTSEGSNTDLNGKFYLKTGLNSGSIIISFIGYESDTLKFKSGQRNVFEVQLSPAYRQLETVEVEFSKYEDPNKDLFKKIIAHKKINNPDRLEAYQCEAYNKVQIDINNINKDIKDSKVKSVSFMWDMIDSSEERGNHYLPIFISETVSDFYHKTSPNSDKEVIKASKVSGVQNESISLLLGNTYTAFNVYDNFISGFEREFISPISDMGWVYYKYEITDTAYIGPYLSYRMTFEPRRKQEATFYGSMWIDSDTYAITEIDMTLSDDANVNLLNHLQVIRNYVNIDNQWVKSKEKAELDINLLKSDKLVGFYAKKTTYWKDYTLNQPKENDFYNNAQGIEIDSDALNKEDDYWSSQRGEDLSAQEVLVYENIDSLVQTPIYKWGKRLTKMFYTGYLPFEKWEFGPYYTAFSFNNIEGNRFRFGGATKKAFHDKFRLHAYTAYGTVDQQLKYQFKGEYFFSKRPRVLITASILHDYRQLSDSPDAWQPDNIMASLSRRANPQFTMLNQQMIMFDKEWVRGISNKFQISRNNYRPVGELVYQTRSNERLDEISISTFMFAGRFAFQEKFVEGDFDRVSLGTRSPIITYGVSYSKKGLLSSEYDFTKVFLQFNDRWYLGPFGYINCIADASKIWGEVPYPILLQHPGNNSYYFDDYAFNLMNPGEFASDQFVSLKMEYHLVGMFLNKVPIMRKLQWRELLYARSVVGSLEYDHESVVLFPSSMNSLGGKPYVEVGVGLENIFKIVRLDYIWRLTHESPNAPKSGLLGGLVFVF